MTRISSCVGGHLKVALLVQTSERCQPPSLRWGAPSPRSCSHAVPPVSDPTAHNSVSEPQPPAVSSAAVASMPSHPLPCVYQTPLTRSTPRWPCSQWYTRLAGRCSLLRHKTTVCTFAGGSGAPWDSLRSRGTACTPHTAFRGWGWGRAQAMTCGRP